MPCRSLSQERGFPIIDCEDTVLSEVAKLTWDLDYVGIGKRIYHARKEELGMTQEQLAEIVGKGREHISRIERAKRHASVSLLVEIGEKLGMGPLEILYGIRTDENNEYVRETINVLYRLGTMSRRRVLNYAEKLELEEAN